MKSTVLYVDDETALCRAFERALRGPGIEVTTLTSAPQAAELLGKRSFDLIATDYRMPELNGLDLLRLARERHPRARRLLVSGRIDGDQAAQEIAAADVDQIIYKPWSLDELRRAIARSAELAALQRALARSTVETLLGLLEIRDPALAAHSRRVAALALVLCDKLGVDGAERDEIEQAALVHDVGGLTLCPTGADLLDRIHVAPRICAIVRAHHDRTDPSRGSRILDVAHRHELDAAGVDELVAELAAPG